VSTTWQVALGVEPDERLLALLRELEEKPVSRLTRHAAPCCAIAEAWFRATARAAVRRFGDEPRWISKRWEWGPTAWPIAWCEAIKEEALDCGALADLAAVAFEEAGREVVRVQLIDEASPEECEQWAVKWAAVPTAPRWIWHGLVYHETVSVRRSEGLRVWDPVSGRWENGKRAKAMLFFPARG